MKNNNSQETLSRKDFETEQEIRWCPGCGDYAILSQIQRYLPELGVPKENIVFFSGIGCSSRLPYYLDTYGFHSIHGRATTFATGLKISRPDLVVFIVTGDGDGLSIGGNHLIHALRRNMDINIILFNNRTYGLTKGQFSPTSELGKKTVSSPLGTIEHPISPALIALAAEASFVARSIATDGKHLSYTLNRAANHRGSCFLEVYQNCNVYNDGAFDYFGHKDVRAQQTIKVMHDKPLVFGSKNEKAIKLKGVSPIVCDSNDSNVLIHDEKTENNVLPYLLAHMTPSDDLPLPLGVLRAVERQTYDQGMHTKELINKNFDSNVASLLRSGHMWDIN